MSEEGQVRKDPGGKLNIALVYPNTYWLGMSNLGVHTLYRVFNAHPGIVCERFFTDHPRSIEAGRPLSDFPLIAFSVSYELDCVHMVRILMENKIPVRARERKGPIIIAGGSVLTMNPEPVAEALDVCFLGDGEPAAGLLYDVFLASSSREEFLERLEGKPGIYIPLRTGPEIRDGAVQGFQGLRPTLSLVNPLETPAHTLVLSPETAFGDMFLVETARGCPYHCKFCTAREIYAPFRPVAIEHILPVFDKAQASGLKLGLVSTSLNNHPQAARMYEEIEKRGIQIAPPSLRFGMLTKELLEHMRRSKVRGVTLAPETGSEDLRHAIGKPITNGMVLDDITALIAAGIRNIKLYFMVGLPRETLHDIDDTIDFISRIRQTFIRVSRGNQNLGEISLNINTFVPKPHSLFERETMITINEAKTRIKRIENGLKRTSNVHVTFEGPKWAYLQGVIARGDRKVLDLIMHLAQKPEYRWQDVLKCWPENPDYYALRPRSSDEILPWSFSLLPNSLPSPQGA